MAFADLIVGKWNRNLFPWFTPGSRLSGCISFVSYIKPQWFFRRLPRRLVVYLSFPTSNHNLDIIKDNIAKVVYLSFPTSNHNRTFNCRKGKGVVYLSFPTSNHNFARHIALNELLYIFRFLHQTTTMHPQYYVHFRCISFVSYIKPQLL